MRIELYQQQLFRRNSINITLFPLINIQMEINKPDKGLFRGMAKLQQDKHINKKYFPRIRNIHQFELTHNHHNDYISSFQRFFSAKHHISVFPDRPKQNTNNTTFQLGQDTSNYYQSLSKENYKKIENFQPPKPIRQKEEGIALGNETKGQLHFITTAMQKFGVQQSKEKKNIAFHDRGLQRFNPITGQIRTLSFGFQDFSMNRNNTYKANNLTVMPQSGQAINIINGRKLTYK